MAGETSAVAAKLGGGDLGFEEEQESSMARWLARSNAASRSSIGASPTMPVSAPSSGSGTAS